MSTLSDACTYVRPWLDRSRVQTRNKVLLITLRSFIIPFPFRISLSPCRLILLDISRIEDCKKIGGKAITLFTRIFPSFQTRRGPDSDAVRADPGQSPLRQKQLRANQPCSLTKVSSWWCSRVARECYVSLRP